MESPSKIIVLLPGENNRKNYFKSIIYKQLLKEESTTTEDGGQKKSELLKDLLICCICYDYLNNPVYDQTCCPHYACQTCFEEYFQKKKSNIVPCPICRKMIKQENLTKIPLFESIKEIIVNKGNTTMNDDNIFFNAKCKEHPKNFVFFYCLDCQLKMCPACNKEKHNKHHLVNYERYVNLFDFIQKNFSGIKKHISDREEMIREYKELIVLTEQKKNAYLQCLNDISSKIKRFYNENIEKMNKIIGENMQKIAFLRNFMLNVKYHISSRFKISYNDIENLEDLEEEVIKRVKKLKLKEINKNEFDIVKQNSIQKMSLVSSKIIIPLSFNRQILLDKSNIKYTDKEDVFTFGLELSEDKDIVNAYLDIEIKNEQIKNSSYAVFIEYGNKHKILFLESSTNPEKKKYSYEKNLNIEELDDIENDDIVIVLNVLSISL